MRIEFSTGGYVIHKATVPGSDRTFSAWFDKQGKLVDAQARDKRGRVFPVSHMNARWQCGYLQRIYGVRQ